MTPKEFCLELGKVRLDETDIYQYVLNNIGDIDLSEPKEYKPPLAHSAVKSCDCECHKVMLDNGKCNRCCMYEGWRS